MKKNTKRILIASCIGIFLCMLDTTVMNIALPTMKDSLNVSLEQLSWALNAYTILFAGLTIPLSRVSDYLGRERIYIVALILFLISSLLCGLSFNLEMLIISRSLQGIAASIIFPLSMIIGISTAEVEKRKVVIAALGVTQGFAAAIGPTIGGIFTQYLGWHWIFFINIPLVLISLALCLSKFKFVEKSNIAKLKTIDYLGAFWAILCMFSLIIIIIEGNTWGWFSTYSLILMLIFIVGIIIFINHELKHDDPIIPLNIFKNNQFLATSITVLLSNIYLLGIMVTLPSMLTNVGGYTSLEAAILITPISFMIFLFSPISAILNQKIGPRIIISMGFISMSLGYFLLSSNWYSSFFQFAIICSIIGFGYGIIIGPATVLAASDFTEEMLTASQSVIGVVRQVGTVIGVALFVSFLTVNIDNAKVEAINNSNSIINNLDITDSSKKQMEEDVKYSIENEQDPEKKDTYISAGEREEIIDNLYEEKTRGVSLTDDQKVEVRNEIEVEVDKKISDMDKEIKKGSNIIANETKSYMLNAFLSLYKSFILIILLSFLVVFLFPK